MAPHRVLTRSVTSTRLQNKTEKVSWRCFGQLPASKPLRPCRRIRYVHARIRNRDGKPPCGVRIL